MTFKPGLYVVATPIGNLGDISSRAQEILQKVDVVLTEDTRSFALLARSLGLSIKRTVSYHEHNERGRTKSIIGELAAGKTFALTSERGTPGICDPGYRLLKAAREENIYVSPIPGPCAAIAALSISGFEIDCFQFLGFIPTKSGKRKEILSRALTSSFTSVMYESPFRIIKALSAISEISPQHDLCLCRELTKMHEEILFGTAQELITHLTQKPKIKGEFVLVTRRLKAATRT